MGCRILEDSENGACFYCSTTGVAFGPVMSNREEADLFLRVLGEDPRSYSQDLLMDQYAEFVDNYVCECGNLRDEMDAQIKAEDENGKCWCENDSCATCRAEQKLLELPAELPERFVCYQCVRRARPKKGRKQFPPSHFGQRSKYAAEPEPDIERDRR